MRNNQAGKRSSGTKGIVWGLTLLVVAGVFCFASANDTLSTFSGVVWNDVNNNGLMDPGEPAVSGVSLHLTREDTGELLTAVSDEAGYYIFTELPNDAYAFSVDLPPAMLLARYTSEGDLRSIPTGDDVNNYRNFVIRYTDPRVNMNLGLVDSAIVRGIAYLDMNYNGNYDEGEPPYAGVKLQFIRNYVDRPVQQVITGEDGVFVFDYVRTGNYRFRAIVPDDGSTFTLVPDTIGYFSNLFQSRPGRRENSVDSIDVENSMVYEYYIGLTLGGEINGTVFNDKDYSGVKNGSDSALSGIAVQLVGADGAVVAQTNSSKSGAYTLKDVMPGNYTLRFVRKDGYTFTKYRPLDTDGNDAVLSATGAYGETEPFSVAMSQVLTDFNAGLVQAATVDGVFFYDENDNGLMDKAEGGFTDGSVRLVSDDGEIDIIRPVDADGSYTFSGVAPTSYTLYYMLPEHAEMARVQKGGNTVAHQGSVNAVAGLVLKANKHYTQPLAGAVKLGTFEGMAFEDLNADGIRDAGEAALAGVSVSVSRIDGSGDAAAAVSDGNGAYSVTGLRPGEYKLEVLLPEGLIFSHSILASGIPLDTVGAYSAPVLFSTLLRRVENHIGAVMPATLQASIWLDENRSGTRDDGESMVGGLLLTLVDEASGQAVSTAQTGADGTATFTAVRPSTYTVMFELPADSQPVVGVGTLTESEGIMRQSGIEIHAGDAYTDITGGLVSTTSIGGTVLADQSGGRAPIGNVEVRLYAEGNPSLLGSTVSDAQGRYRFDGLWPGGYVLEVVRPDGYVFVRPNDPAISAQGSVISQISDEFGTSDIVALQMAQDSLQNNVLFTIPAKVGSIVWLDENENGLIDGNEPMIGGVTISLMQDNAAIYTTTSNEWGYYEFANVYPGEYTLRAYAYPELDITTAIPAVKLISSCLTLGDGSIAVSDPFKVESETVNFSYHLGYILKNGETLPAEVTAGGVRKVWTRTN
ncbi:MAG: hypothetical protein FNP40_00185 [Dehalobacter sp. 4CP]|nr:hypothetical protein [Dehalobacter sp. 4CP]